MSGGGGARRTERRRGLGFVTLAPPAHRELARVTNLVFTLRLKAPDLGREQRARDLRL